MYEFTRRRFFACGASLAALAATGGCGSLTGRSPGVLRRIPIEGAVPTGSGVIASGLAVAGSARRVYTAPAGGPGQVVAFDLDTGTKVGTWWLTGSPLGRAGTVQPRDFVVSDDGRHLYVSVVGLPRGRTLVLPGLSTDPSSIDAVLPFVGQDSTLTADGSRIWTPDFGGGTSRGNMAAFDTTTGARVVDVRVSRGFGMGASGVGRAVLSADGRRVFAADIARSSDSDPLGPGQSRAPSSRLVAIDVASRSISMSREIAVGGTVDVAVTSDGSSVLVVDAEAGRMDVLDASTLEIRDSVDLTIRGYSGTIAVTPDGRRAVVGTTPLAIVDLRGPEVVDTLDATNGRSPVALAVDSARGHVAVLGDDIAVVDPGSS